MTEADIFKIIIPIASKVTEQVTAIDQEQMRELLSFCQGPKSAREIMSFLGLKHREYFRSKILRPLIEQKKLLLLYPDKPRSSKQKYYSKQE